MIEMKERISKLLTVKSIVTILVTITFVYLSIVGVISADNFMTVFTVVIAFYFGTQHEKQSVANSAAETACVDVADCPYLVDTAAGEFNGASEKTEKVGE
jgi:dolichyl-phosphate-mannose--protein O-mannosyl transferase